MRRTRLPGSGKACDISSNLVSLQPRPNEFHERALKRAPSCRGSLDGAAKRRKVLLAVLSSTMKRRSQPTTVEARLGEEINPDYYKKFSKTNQLDENIVLHRLWLCKAVEAWARWQSSSNTNQTEKHALLREVLVKVVNKVRRRSEAEARLLPGELVLRFAGTASRKAR